MVGLSRFVGREADHARVSGLVREHRLVTVTGPGGVGKTRLVQEVAGSLRAGDVEVRIGELGPIPAGAGADEIGAALGLRSPEAVALSLAETDAVVVLDNCEHVLDGAVDFVRRLLAAGDRTRVLTTSRQPLGLVGERVVVLDPLAPPGPGEDPLASPAVELFLELAAAAGAPWERSDANLAAVADLCRQVDGLPLAIELAASRARALAPAELLALVTDRLDLLRGDGPDRPDRHRSVRAAIAVSVDLLTEEQQALFVRLGIFDGPFDLPLVHAVAGDADGDPLATVDLLGALVERSLVVAEPDGHGTRYRMLELVREHAADLLRSAGLWAETCERLTGCVVAETQQLLAAAAERWTPDLLVKLTGRFHHVVAAIDRCIAVDRSPRRAYGLFVSLFAGLHQGRSAEVRMVGDRLLARWPDDPGPMRGEALAVLATAYAIGTDAGRAEELARAALAVSAERSVAAVAAERALALVGLCRADDGFALEHARRGRELASDIPMPAFQRELRGFEASLVDRTGDVQGALELAAKVVAESVAADDPITEIWGRLVGVIVSIRAGLLDEAKAELEAAKARSASINDGWWTGGLRRAEAFVAAHVSESDGWVESAAIWREAIESAAARGDLSELAQTLVAAASVAVRFGHEETARALLAAAPTRDDLTVLPDAFQDRSAVDRLRPDRPGGSAPTLVAAVRAAVAALGSPSERRPPAADDTRPSLRWEGDVWTFRWRGDTVRVRALKGIADLAVLLARAGEEVHCLELMGGADVGGDAGPALDERARREYQARIVELQSEIDEATAANDRGRAEKAELELDALIEQLSGAFGLGGRARGSGSSAERARTAVTYRVRAAVRRITEHHPELGKHLAHSVRTGTWCSYRPEQDVRWDVERHTV